MRTAFASLLAFAVAATPALAQSSGGTSPSQTDRVIGTGVTGKGVSSETDRNTTSGTDKGKANERGTGGYSVGSSTGATVSSSPGAAGSKSSTHK